MARRRPGKAEAGFFRAAAYLNAGCPEQALKDARYALVYGPQLEGSGVTALVPSGSGDQGSSAAGGGQGGVGGGQSGAGAAALPPAVQQPLSAWPAGLALLAAAHEALAENVPAALAMQASDRGQGHLLAVCSCLLLCRRSLHPSAAARLGGARPATIQAAHQQQLMPSPCLPPMQRALELEPECEDYQEAIERLMRRIPEACAEALRVRARGRPADDTQLCFLIHGLLDNSCWHSAACRALPQAATLDTSNLTTCCCLLPLTLQAGGAAGLEAHLAGEAEAAKPEYLRQRPKYYYYFEWMKKRILAQASGCGWLWRTLVCALGRVPQAA